MDENLTIIEEVDKRLQHHRRPKRGETASCGIRTHAFENTRT
jgi:hypothetical protein